MSATPKSLHELPPYQASQAHAQPAHLNTNSEQTHQQPQHNFHSSLNEHHISRTAHTFPTSKESIARKLQRIDILLNLVYSRVANDRSLKALLPYIPEHDARNLVSNFAYIRHQQDTQELKAEMTDKQTYRIFRHHYRAEQRLADTLRELRHSTPTANSQQLLETTPASKPIENNPPLSDAAADLENDTAKVRVRHLQQVENELNQMSSMYQGDDDLLYIQEFSQAQQINTMQARCVAMKDEYEADDMRKGRCPWEVSEIRKASKENISGPEDWEEDPPQFEAAASTLSGLGVLNGEWTPPDPPRSPCPEGRLSHMAGATDEKRFSSANAVYTSEPYANENLSHVYSKEYRERRSRRQPGSDRPENRHERREKKTFRNENRQRTAQLSGRSERRDRRGSSSRKSFMVANPERKNGSKLEDHDFRQQRYSSYRPPLPSHNQGRRHRLESHMPQITSKRPGRSQRTSRTRVTPKNSSPLTPNQAIAEKRGDYYSNTEFATMPNLRRTSLGYHRDTSYDDCFMPLQGGSGHQSHYVEGHTLDPFHKPFPHESADAFGWKPPEATMGGQYNPGLGAPEQPEARYPQPEYPRFPPNPSAPSFPQSGLQSHGIGDEMPVTKKTRKRDEWRYNNGLASGLLDKKKGAGVIQNIASTVKGRKAKAAVPHNAIEAMQMARKDPVKLMTTMVAGEVMPQAKRKAHKFESMIANESKDDGVTGHVGKMLTKVAKESMTHGASSKAGVPGHVGKMLTKVAKESMTHGASSKTGVPGHVGQMLAKMTLDSAVGGGSSKANVTSQVGNVLAKVAKDSVKQAGGSSSGAKMVKQVVNSLANA